MKLGTVRNIPWQYPDSLRKSIPDTYRSHNRSSKKVGIAHGFYQIPAATHNKIVRKKPRGAKRQLKEDISL